MNARRPEAEDRPWNGGWAASFAPAVRILGALGLVELAAFAPRNALLQPRLLLLEVGAIFGLALFAVAVATSFIGIIRLCRATAPSPSSATRTVALCLACVGELWPWASSHSGRLVDCLGETLGILLFTGLFAAAFWLLMKASSRLRVSSAQMEPAIICGLATFIALDAVAQAGFILGPDGRDEISAGVVAAPFAVVIGVAAWAGLRKRRSWMIACIGVGVSLLLLRLMVPNSYEAHETAKEGGAALQRATGPSVLLIVLDTFRADALSLESPELSNTPHLASLAQRSNVYPRGIANASWTLPGHASLLTGLLLAHHRTDVTSASGFSGYLSPSIPTLTEILADHGYETTCIAANGLVGFQTGLARGCQYYHRPGRAWIMRPLPFRIARMLGRSHLALSQLLLDWTGINVNATAREIVDSIPERATTRTRGQFIFLNFLDVHAPWQPNPEAGPERRAERLAFHRDLIRRTVGAIDDGALWSRNAELLRRDYYHQARVLDSELGRLLGQLEKSGWLDQALVVITSDHGEAFGENPAQRNYFGHHSAYEPAVRIPLLIKHPNQRTARVASDRFQQIDILPTVLDVLGIELPRPVDGQALGRGAQERAVTEWYPRPRSDFYEATARFGLYADQFKYVLSSDGSEALYDVDADPFELNDLASERTDILIRLRNDLSKRVERPQQNSSRDSAPIDQLLQEQLRALGYAK